jgi:hypothetical protein
MNFIAFDAAYSLYPRATFEERRALAFTSLGEHDLKALGKYQIRGWSIMCNDWPPELVKSRAYFYTQTIRAPRDSMSWVVPLGISGVEPRPRLSSSSEAFSWDPVIFNSWSLIKSELGHSLMSYHIARPTLFRYAYLVVDLGQVHDMFDFFKAQGNLEHRIVESLPADQKAASWTWYFFCASRRLLD